MGIRCLLLFSWGVERDGPAKGDEGPHFQPSKDKKKRRLAVFAPSKGKRTR